VVVLEQVVEALVVRVAVEVVSLTTLQVFPVLQIKGPQEVILQGLQVIMVPAVVAALVA
jgi:hypothetical protein